MTVLDGNVRYLRIRSFHWQPDATGAAYDSAMRFLRDGDAVIVDLRGNGGGSTSAVRYAISHFMPASPERLMMTFQGDDGAPDQSRVLGHLPAGRVTIEGIREHPGAFRRDVVVIALTLRPMNFVCQMNK